MMEVVGVGPGNAGPVAEGQGPDVVTFDTETTGLWWADRVVELAAVRVRGDGVVLGRWWARVHPEGPIPARVTALHGIADADVAGLAPAAAVLGDFRRFVSGALLVAHNAVYDRDILATEFVRAGISPPPESLVCSLALSRRLVPEAPRHGLHRLGAHLALPPGIAHRALDDATLTLGLWRVLRQRLIAAGQGLTEGIAATEGAGPHRFAEAVRRLSSGELSALGLAQLGESLRSGRPVTVHPAAVEGAVPEPVRGVVRAAYARGEEAVVDLVVAGATGASRVQSVALGKGVWVSDGA